MTGRPHEGVSSVVMHDVREIETWILRLLSAPVCVPDKTRVEVRQGNGGDTYFATLIHRILIFVLQYEAMTDVEHHSSYRDKNSFN